ncbi:MAG: hypothetical protein FWB82_05605 [Treponema sp.]|nr:hypothetical protein [Treponema sp.]
MTKLDNMIAWLEKACDPERRFLYVDDVAEEDLRAAFAAFQNRRAKLARINSLSVSGRLLPALTELLEPEGVESIRLASGDSQSHWPFLEKYRNLTELKISKTANIPESIGNLQRLERLSLSWCGQLKSLPESIGKLKNLALLEMRCMDSIDQVPDSICNLENLTSLKIMATAIEEVPEGIGSLESLTCLSLRENKKLKSLPESTGKLKNLTWLDLYNSTLLNALPDSIVNLNSLEYVNIRLTGIQSVPHFMTQVKTYRDNKRHEMIPQCESFSTLGFANCYYRLVETISFYNQKAISEGILALEEELEVLENDFFRRGIRLLVDGTDEEVIRPILTTIIEREHDYYRKKLMNIALEGILGIQDGMDTSQIIFRLNSMVEIKDNPIDSAWERCKGGDKNAFLNIDFKAAQKPESEREEISFIKRAFYLSGMARREGYQALEACLDKEGIAAGDILEYGLSLFLGDGCLIDCWKTSAWRETNKRYDNQKNIQALFSKLVERAPDPVQKNLAMAKKEAVLSINAGDNPRILFLKLTAYFDRSIANAIEEWGQEEITKE